MSASQWTTPTGPVWFGFPWHIVLGGLGIALLVSHHHGGLLGIVLIVAAIAFLRRRRWAMASGCAPGGWSTGWQGGWQCGWGPSGSPGGSPSGGSGWRAEMRDAWRRFTDADAPRPMAPSPSSGNSAFDAYRAETLRKLEEDQREFGGFLDRLRHARDKAEFDQFMAERTRGTYPPPPAPPPPHEPPV